MIPFCGQQRARFQHRFRRSALLCNIVGVDMNLATNVVSALQLKRCEVPLELQSNFAALRHVPLFFAGHIRKLNHRFTVQDRVLIATLDHIYICDPNGDILRCFPYGHIETVLVDLSRHQMALVVPKEYDVAFATPETHKLLHVIEVIRGLHHCSTSCQVESISSAASLDADLPNSTAQDEAEQDDEGGANGGGGKAAETRWQRFVGWVRGKKNVIKEEWFTGAANSNCIGRGYYTLRLKQPAGFVLNLHNRNE